MEDDNSARVTWFGDSKKVADLAGLKNFYKTWHHVSNTLLVL